VEQVSLRGLHREPVAATDAQVDLHGRRGKAPWTPPFRQLHRLGARLEHRGGRCPEDAFHLERQLAWLPVITGLLVDAVGHDSFALSN
jgi:hypothetical protein